MRNPLEEQLYREQYLPWKKTIREWETWSQVTGNALFIKRGQLKGFITRGRKDE